MIIIPCDKKAYQKCNISTIFTQLLELTVQHSRLLFSTNARSSVRQRDGNHPANVPEEIPLPDQVARPEGLPHPSPDS